MSILDETRNLIRLHLHTCGTSEVPKDFDIWAMLSVIAAAVGDRVYYKKFADDKLMPNMYTVLVGPSAIGKEQAIRRAAKYVYDIPIVNYYRGKVTAPHIIDYMARPQKFNAGTAAVVNTKLFLVTPELAMSIGKNDKANDFVKFMTDIYGGSDGPWREGTRSNGKRLIHAPTMNWLAGTTKPWFFEAVSREAFLSGFFARTAYVEADYDLNLRVVDPTYPEDKDEVKAHIQERMEALTQLEGEFRLDDDARMIRDSWYRNRPAPDDEVLIASWKREDDFVLKIAMLLSLSDGKDGLMIRGRHITNAQRLSRDINKKLPYVVQSAMMPDKARGLELVMRVMEQNQRVQRLVLMRIVGARGILGRELDDIMGTLIQQGRVKVEIGERGGRIYTWLDTTRRKGSSAGTTL